MRIYFNSDKGKRRNNNEDNLAVLNISDDVKVLMVADGVAGELDGEIASEIATTMVGDFISKNIDLSRILEKDYIKQIVTNAIEYANDIIVQKQESNDTKMSTTLVLAFINKNTIHVFNIGDSRLYLFTDDKLVQITNDHTYVQELVDAKLITEKEAKTHRDRNIVTRVLGNSNIKLDSFFIEAKENDIILLCSDGLNSMVEDGEISKIVRKNTPDEKKIVNDLISVALRNGGWDNITIVCAIDFKE